MVTHAQLNLTLSANESQAVETFLLHAREKFGDNLLRAALFGSKARGDSMPDSDLDLLLIVKDDRWQVQRPLIELGAEIGLQFDVLFDLRIISQERWARMVSMQAGLVQNITKESIPLAG